jgi:hypothetical protein
MFGKAKLYERLLNEKDMHIRLLAAEIDWLRAQLGRPSLPAVISPSVHNLKNDEPAELGHATWESEEDEAQKILEKYEISGVHLPEILDGLGYGVSDLS